MNGRKVIVPPVYTGVAFLFSWTYLMFYATSAGIEAAAPISLYSAGYSISAVFVVVTLVVIAFSRIDRTALLTDIRTKVLTGVALPIGTVLLLFTGYNYAPFPLLVVGGIITGVFSGVMLLQWVVAYQRVGLRVSVASFPMLMALSVGICVTLMYLPRFLIVIAIIAFPLVSEVMFHELRKNPWPQIEGEAADAPDRPINFTLMLLPFAVYAFASGFLDYSSTDNGYTFAFYALGAFIPVVTSGVYTFIVERESFVSAFLVPLSILIAVCIPFLSMSELAPFAPFISIGELGIEVLIFIVPVGFAEFFSLDTQKTYALGRLVYVIFNAVGWYVAQLADQAYGYLLHSQVTLVIIFVSVEVLTVCLIVAIVKAQKSPAYDDGQADEMGALTYGEAETAAMNGESGTALESQADAAPSAEISTDTGANVGKPPNGIADTTASVSPDGGANTVADLCEEYGLSNRERDVFALLARGYTSPRIQKELYIAAGTVNYHSRNIYAKLGVHSKQELIQLFEGRVRQDSQ